MKYLLNSRALKNSYQKTIMTRLVDEGTMEEATENLAGLTSYLHTIINQAVLNYVHHLMNPCHIRQ